MLHTVHTVENACNNVLTKQGRIQGGPGGQKPTPSFGGTPKLYQEGKNVECMHVNGPHFSTSDVHPPYQNPVFTPVERLSRFGETSKFPQPSMSIIPSVGPSSFWCKWLFVTWQIHLEWSLPTPRWWLLSFVILRNCWGNLTSPPFSNLHWIT